MKKYKLAVLETHPVSYRLPIYRELSKNKKIELIVYFCSDFGTKKVYDPELNKIVKFEFNLSGFKYKILKNYSLKRPQPPRGLFNLGIISELLKNKYDGILIYGYSPMTHKIATLFAKIIKTPVLFRDEIHEITGGKLKRTIKNFFYKFWFKMPSVFLYSYTKSKEFYLRFGINEKKLFFVPCAVDNEYFQQKAKELSYKSKQLREEIRIKNNYPILLFVGKLSPRKRPFDLMKSFEKLYPKANLIFIGEGIEKERIMQYIKKKKIKNVYFAGFKKTSELVKYYSVADIFVLTSEYDPSPKVLNEAMNFSLPVIISNKAGTAKDLVKQDKNGFIYSCGDIAELAKYIEILLKNTRLRKKMGAESLNLVSKWTPKKDAEGIIEALDYIYKNE